MKIRRIFKRVGESSSTYEYLAEIDLELDVTKYGHDKIEDRYKKDIFTIDVLSSAKNFDLYIEEISKCDYEWWKTNFNNELGQAVSHSKFIYRFSRIKLRKILLKLRVTEEENKKRSDEKRLKV